MKNIFKKFASVLIAIAFLLPGIALAAPFFVSQGGTGVGTITGIPYGTGTAPLGVVSIGSGLSFVGGTLSSTNSGTVTAVSVASANGFAGSSSGGATPALTLSTTVTGLLKGNGTAISAATAGTDYVTASSTNTFTNKTYDTAGTGNSFAINGTGVTAVTGTGSVVLATSPTLVTPALGTPSALIGTNITGTAANFTSGLTNALKSATTTVNVSSATAPTSGQVLTATSGTAATWQTPASGTVTSVSGTANRITSTGGAISVIDISASYVGQASITTLGTITTGTWTGTTIAVANGGTNCTSATITCFNNITGFSAAGTTGTTSTNLVFSTSPTLITPVLGAATATSVTGSTTLLLAGKDGSGSGAGNAITIQGGNGGGTSGAGASVNIAAGNALGGASNGGNVILQAGSKSGAGTVGQIKLTDVNSGFSAILATTTIAANRIFTFPDQAGTFTVLGNTTTGSGSIVLATSPTLVTPALGAATYTTLSGGNVTDSGLTAGRVTFAGTAGILSDDADMTFATDTLTVTKIGATTLAGTATLAENSSIALDPAGSADGKYTGTTVTAVAGYAQTYGDLVYLDPTDSRWEKTDSNSAQGADGDARGIVGIVVVAGGSDGAACTILLQGIIRADAAFPTFTVNNQLYVSETAGLITGTQPTTTDVVIKVVGVGITADEMYFNPSMDYITHI